MFLLSKLDEVARRFPEDVARARSFLLDRGIPAGSLEALPHFSARLAIDPSFQRDVTSLVQVVIEREGETVDYMDLLGILVTAAAGAGPLRANEEQEESVREILRFLTQIRRPDGAVMPVYVRSQNVVPRAVAVKLPAVERAFLPVAGGDDVVIHPVPVVSSFQLEDEERPQRRGAAVWIAAGLAVAVAVGSGWMYERGRVAPQTTAAVQVAPSTSSAVDESEERATTPARRAEKFRGLGGRRSSAADGHARAVPVKPGMTGDGAQVSSVGPLDAGRNVPLANVPLPAKGVTAESHSVNRPVDAEGAAKSTLSANTRSTPPENTASASAPSVRRRLPKSIWLNDPPARRRGGSPDGVNASMAGVVHPASLGMMASNLISSPAPAYPAAASQAQVQGVVRVRATVDRDGNVIDARVVSGPELLRDASLEAVQRWHYRPYMQDGKPVEVATTAILDFELP